MGIYHSKNWPSKDQSRFTTDDWEVLCRIDTHLMPINCCGLWELNSVLLGTRAKEAFRDVMHRIDGDNVKNLAYITTQVEEHVIEAFADYGFEVIQSFFNPNSGNEVKILFKSNYIPSEE